MPSRDWYADVCGDDAPVVQSDYASRNQRRVPKKTSNHELPERHGNFFTPGRLMIDVYGEYIEIGVDKTDGSPVYAKWGNRKSHEYVTREHILYDMMAGVWYIYPGGQAEKEADILARDPNAKLAGQ